MDAPKASRDTSEPSSAMLSRIESFGYLSPAHLGRISAAREVFSSGQQICREGEDADDLIVIVAGQAEASLETPLGSQRAALLGPGDIFGEISLVDGQPRASSVTALGDGELLRIDLEHLRQLAAEDPSFEQALLRCFCRSLARKVRSANHAMIEIMAPDGGTKQPGASSSGQRGDLDEATKREILREQGISDDELRLLIQFVQEQRYAPGDIIFVEGSEGDTLYIIADGKVRISRQVPGLGEEALAILGRGEIFGEMAWIDSRPRSADAIAHGSGCTVLGISRHDMEAGSHGAADDSGDEPPPGAPSPDAQSPDAPSPGAPSHDAQSHDAPSHDASFLRLLCEILSRRIRAMNNQLVAWRTLSFRF